MIDTEKQRGQLAGTVLALLGIVTYGATSQFGLVLSLEWIRDPRRDSDFRLFDWMGVIVGLPGTMYFLYFTAMMFDYAPGGQSFGSLLLGYWAMFGLWIMYRRRTRWVEIQRYRNEVNSTKLVGDETT